MREELELSIPQAGEWSGRRARVPPLGAARGSRWPLGRGSRCAEGCPGTAPRRSRASLGESPSASQVRASISCCGIETAAIQASSSPDPSPARWLQRSQSRSRVVVSPLVASPDEIHHDALHKTAMRLAPSELVMERIVTPCRLEAGGNDPRFARRSTIETVVMCLVFTRHCAG